MTPEASARLILANYRRHFGRDLVAVDELHGVVEAEHLAAKKPGLGIPANDLDTLIGKTLTRAVTRDQFLSKDDLGGPSS